MLKNPYLHQHVSQTILSHLDDLMSCEAVTCLPQLILELKFHFFLFQDAEVELDEEEC